MEAPVISACVPSLQHLILVGDHKQLRPQCAVKDLQNPPFSLNVSLFERLVNNNNLEYSMLKRQRRMIPEIRRILKPIYGKEIVDHPSMTDLTVRPPVPGLGGCNSFFYSHSWPEAVDDQTSSMNHMEADMIVGFFDYLVNNGLTEKEITVLTFYHGQRKLLLRKLREHPQLGRSRIYKIVTVDSYQGEENDVVILSMVRSNDIGKIGFLGVENRVCVALSRAKRGFYIFGNAELLCSESKLWARVVTMMAGKAKEIPITGPKCRVVFRIPLHCANHGRKTWVEGTFLPILLIIKATNKVAEPDEWEMINGGCHKKCGYKLECGHECQLTCHPFDHNFVSCGEKCPKVLPCRHNCDELCGDLCFCAKCNIKYGERADSLSRTSTSQEASSVENWTGYAGGGYKKHDMDLREKLREMDRLAEKEPYGLRDKFLSQQADRIGTPTLQEASTLQTPTTRPSSTKNNLPPRANASSLSVSPPKTFNHLSNSIPAVARNGDRTKLTYDSRTSELLTGYSGSTGPKRLVSKINGQRPLTAPPLSMAFPQLAHPQHPAPPQHSHLNRSDTKPRGLENTVNKMVSRKNPSGFQTPAKNQVKAVVVESDLLIDLS
jgi:helicase required for RNAi-mediated heterochromatin assembly 1